VAQIFRQEELSAGKTRSKVIRSLVADFKMAKTKIKIPWNQSHYLISGD